MGWSARNRLAVLGAMAAGVLAACGDFPCSDPVSVPAPRPGADVVAQLISLPNVIPILEQPSRYPDRYRLLILELDQPVDYCAPSGARFVQTATLLYRGTSAPMVFRTAGYGISRNPVLSEPAALLDANQLTLEHRFFGPSTPDPVDWKALTVEQAANDHHRLIQSLKRIFPGKWLTTGASKDGMSAIFHRYFYPDDVDATVAYVAPLMFSRTDPRFPPFIDANGDPSCQDALKTYQRTLLQRRSEVEPEFVSYAAAASTSFNTFGLSKAYDYSTVESSFAFWQYGDASMCATIPSPTATPAELFQLLVDVQEVPQMTDRALAYYRGFFYQSATELGSPDLGQQHLLDLTGGVPIDDLVENYPPFGVTKNYDPSLMEKVDAWVKGSASKVLLVYGSADPWSAGAMTVSEANDSYRYFVDGGNHYSDIAQLPEPAHSAALAAISRWMGVALPARGGPATPRREADRDEQLLPIPNSAFNDEP